MDKKPKIDWKKFRETLWAVFILFLFICMMFKMIGHYF